MSATSWVSPVCTPVALSRAYKQSTTPPLSGISSNFFPRKSEAPTTNLRRSVEHGGLRLNARSSSTAKRLNVVRARNVDDNMDDKGVVKDMEQYLNDLAIEYDNVWDTKPAWYVCQRFFCCTKSVGHLQPYGAQRFMGGICCIHFILLLRTLGTHFQIIT